MGPQCLCSSAVGFRALSFKTLAPYFQIWHSENCCFLGVFPDNTLSSKQVEKTPQMHFNMSPTCFEGPGDRKSDLRTRGRNNTKLPMNRASGRYVLNAPCSLSSIRKISRATSDNDRRRPRMVNNSLLQSTQHRWLHNWPILFRLLLLFHGACGAHGAELIVPWGPQLLRQIRCNRGPDPIMVVPGSGDLRIKLKNLQY